MNRIIECRTKTIQREEYWFLQEISESGNDIGPQFEPWTLGADFIIDSYKSYSSVSIKNETLSPFKGSVKDLREVDIDISTHEIESTYDSGILAKIKPHPADNRTYEFFGTDRKIQNFTLRITPHDHDFCQANCIPAYSYEIDFRGHSESDQIEIIMYCSPKTFKGALELFRSQESKEITLSLTNVRCFYSSDTFGVSTNLIKVIDDRDTPVQYRDGKTIEIFRDGYVRESRLSASQFTGVEKEQEKLDDLPQLETAHDVRQVDFNVSTKIEKTLLSVAKSLNYTVISLWLMLLIFVTSIFVMK